MYEHVYRERHGWRGYLRERGPPLSVAYCTSSIHSIRPQLYTPTSMQYYSAVVEGLQFCLRHRLVRFEGLVDDLRHGEDSLFLQHLPRELKADRGVLERLRAVCNNDMVSSSSNHERTA